MPKIFRRLALDWVSKGNTKLQTFLAAETSPDRCYKTSEFLEQGITVAKQHNLAEFVTNTDVRFKPGDLAFLEAASTLFDKKNRKITTW
jgi:thermostable 8-oxoguanine DNA glycosylase